MRDRKGLPVVGGVASVLSADDDERGLIWIVRFGLSRRGVEVAGWGVAVAGCGVRVAGWGVEVTGWGIEVAAWGVETAGWGAGWGIEVADCEVKVVAEAVRGPETAAWGAEMLTCCSEWWY